MVLADSNIWLALALSKHKFHEAAQSWLAALAREEAVFCRATQQSFLRLLTTNAVLAPYGIPPLTNKAAWGVYQGMRSDKHVTWADEPDGLERFWQKFAATSKASPKLWMDAYLAAFCLAGEYSFVTTDQGFKQFKGLDVLVLSSRQ